MSFQEVKNLRKSGKLREAYQLAMKNLKDCAEAGDSEKTLWAKRAMSWVLYDYLKGYTGVLSDRFDSSIYSKALKVIDNVKKLQLAADEQMFFEQFCWQVGKILSALDNETQVNEIKQLFSKIKEFDLSVSYEPYRYLLIQFHQGLKSEQIYLDFIDWWNCDNFQNQDFKEKSNDEGRTFPSLAEQVYTSYYKHIIDAVNEKSISDDEISRQLNQLNEIISTYPEFKYLHYRRAQLLQLTGKEAEAVKAFLPYAKRNRNQTWVWELLGDLHSSNRQIKISCYCKALMIPTKEEFISKIRIKLAEQLINEKKLDEAKTEIERYYDFRMENGYKIDNKVNSWISMPWYQSAKKKESNTAFYKESAKDANKIFIQDLPDSFIAIDYVNKEKKIVNFLQNRNYRGFFNYSEFDIDPKVGEVYKVKMKPEGDEGYHIVYSMSEEDVDKIGDLFYNFKGNISIHKGNNFGIIEGDQSIFATNHHIKKYRLSDGDPVRGLAMANYDKKKKVWGWRLIKLTN